MPAKKSTIAPVESRPENPALWLKPDEPLMAGGYDWAWCYVMFGEIKGFPQYRVTDRGIVYGRRTQLPNKPNWTALSPKTSKYGYREACLRNRGTSGMRYVHCLVLEAFRGPCPDGMEACHENGDPGDNRIGNLRWDTHQNNLRDKNKHGTMLFGARHQNSRITDEIVLEIRRRLSLNPDRRIIADEFGISMSHVHKIFHRELWPHI